MSVELLDAAGRPRSPATPPGYRRGCSPRNKGRRYPADRSTQNAKRVSDGAWVIAQLPELLLKGRPLPVGGFLPVRSLGCEAQRAT